MKKPHSRTSKPIKTTSQKHKGTHRTKSHPYRPHLKWAGGLKKFGEHWSWRRSRIRPARVTEATRNASALISPLAHHWRYRIRIWISRSGSSTFFECGPFSSVGLCAVLECWIDCNDVKCEFIFFLLNVEFCWCAKSFVDSRLFFFNYQIY